jgi:hypothetical protein
VTSSAVVQIGLGLVFTFLLLSLVATGVREWIAGVLATRAAFLEKGITQLIGNLANEVFQHGLVASMKTDAKGLTKWLGGLAHTQGSKRGPSYLSARTFSAAFLDVLGRLPSTSPPSRTEDPHAPDPPTTPAPAHPLEGSPAGNSLTGRLATAINGLGDDKVGQSLRALWDGADRDVDRFRGNVEHWYDDQMDRVSGWYRRRSQVVLFVIGLVLAAGLNVDTVAITRALAVDANLRQAVAAAASSFQSSRSMNESVPTCPQGTLSGCLQTLRSLELPIGWASYSSYLRVTAPSGGRTGGQNAGEALLKLLGLLITALAVSLGAPFWFGLLNRLTGIRAGGNPPPRSTDTQGSS